MFQHKMKWPVATLISDVLSIIKQPAPWPWQWRQQPIINKMVAESGPSGEEPPRPRRDWLCYDEYDDLDDKYHCFIYQAAATVAGGEPPSPRRAPHPSWDWEAPSFDWLPFAAGRHSSSLESLICAPPLLLMLHLLHWAHHIDSIYNDSRQLEWAISQISGNNNCDGDLWQ